MGHGMARQALATVPALAIIGVVWWCFVADSLGSPMVRNQAPQLLLSTPGRCSWPPGPNSGIDMLAERASVFSPLHSNQSVLLTTIILVLCVSFTNLQGITREGRHKRRETGGRREKYRKKRKFEMGRPAAMTKIGERRVHTVRGRGGNLKFRALRLDSGNFSWGTEVCTRKVRVLDVTYNASNNELVRTKTLVKGAIVLIDAHPFKEWYEANYGLKIGLKKGMSADIEDAGKQSDHVKRKLAARQKHRTLESALDHQFASGRLLAKITSRPGQSGRCDGVVLEGPELHFYQKMIKK